MAYQRGSQWRIWDLHVHTPASIVQHYGADSDDTWNRFFDDLETLPPDIKVLGINDYIFVDGYKRVLEARKRGRLPNIDLVLPVIEFRLDKFGGTEGALSRVNLHVIFSEQIDPNVIEQQFINALPRSYTLSAAASGHGVVWQGIATRESLADLGTRIIETVPKKERSKFGSPLVEGFNNLNVSLERVTEVLESDYFHEHNIVGVGKTEWANVKWTAQSIAEKKNVINSARIVFTAAASSSELDKAKKSLEHAGVHSVLLDCSDAHSFSGTVDKDRIGNCRTWIKADPTFRGLKHALIDPEDRIYLGETPPEVAYKAKHTTRIIDTITIKRSPTSKGIELAQGWFDAAIEFNSGLVAVIGYKGSGKSALTDVLGLVGGSPTEAEWSFLTPMKFRKPNENLSQYFEASAVWLDGSTRKQNLSTSVNSKAVPLLKYVPQDYFEKICNQLPSLDESEFDAELKSVIFSHVSRADRLGKANLNELLRHKTNQLDKRTTRFVTRMSDINREIVQLEKMLLPGYQETLNNQLADLNERLSAIKDNRPKTVRKPKGSATARSRLDAARKKVAEINDQIEAAENERQFNADTIARIDEMVDRLDDLRTEYQNTASDIRELLSELNLKIEDVITFSINTKPIEAKRKEIIAERRKLDKKLDENAATGLHKKLQEANSRVIAFRQDLDAPNQKHQEYRQKLKEWQNQKDGIVGDEETPNTIAFVKRNLAAIKNVPKELNELYQKRRELSGEILKNLSKRKQVLANLYAPVQNFITEHPDIGEEIDIKFGVSIENLGFIERFLPMLNLGKSGPFTGKREAEKELSDLIAAHDPNDPKAAIAFAEEVCNRLAYTEELPTRSINDVARLLRKGHTVEALYDYIFGLEYLCPRYNLKLGSKELSQLSPGERGAMLIVFYLMVDKNKDTLVIDQPEHNLDNGTITRLLVPAIKQAKRQRQVIMVTHNPILAVVCNADQVIVAKLDQLEHNTVTYTSGSLENPAINKSIVDILEGTLRAFDNRNMKYIREYIRALKR